MIYNCNKNTHTYSYIYTLIIYIYQLTDIELQYQIASNKIQADIALLFSLQWRRVADLFDCVRRISRNK